MELLRRFLRNESGATAMEYAAMLVLIIVVCIAAVDAVGNNAFKKYDELNTQCLDAKAKDEDNAQGSGGERARKDKKKHHRKKSER